MWKRLNHPNIVPFRGVTIEPLQLVSEWMPGGELRHYVKKNRNSNLINLVGPLLSTPAHRLTLPARRSGSQKVLLISTYAG